MKKIIIITSFSMLTACATLDSDNTPDYYANTELQYLWGSDGIEVSSKFQYSFVDYNSKRNVVARIYNPLANSISANITLKYECANKKFFNEQTKQLTVSPKEAKNIYFEPDCNIDGISTNRFFSLRGTVANNGINKEMPEIELEEGQRLLKGSHRTVADQERETKKAQKAFGNALNSVVKDMERQNLERTNIYLNSYMHSTK